MIDSRTDQTEYAALIAAGREALLAGDKARAQQLLTEVLHHDPRNEEAWMWLSGAHTDPRAMADCLENVLAINPNNQHAQQGLRWLQTEHGVGVAHLVRPDDTAPTPSEAAPPPPIKLRPRPVPVHSVSTLLEAALHPFAAGVLLGLLRLVGWLRPEQLSLLGDGAQPLGYGSSLKVALVTAALHGVALVVVWLLAATHVARQRVHARGDVFDSLVRSGEVWLPGYLWGGALLLAALGVRLGPGAWRVVSGLCWLLLLLGAALIARKLWRLLGGVNVPERKRAVVMARLLVIIVVGGVVGLGLAGIVTAALLR